MWGNIANKVCLTTIVSIYSRRQLRIVYNQSYAGNQFHLFKDRSILYTMLASCSNNRGGIVALLGPTNTGKTYRAVERMLEWESGMIGLPLRLLAREVYDRITVRVGENRVALVTGEEKRIPLHPNYWVCTVEAMPINLELDFLAVDEIQLATHKDRGHIFTDRLLHARGRQETWFMGSTSMHRIISQLLPTVKFKHYPRYSKLKAKGSATLGELHPRTALITFSAPQVYELAERVRQKKGGAAIVLGSLSPRTRNAQVALYQSGEVDYLVATDAIGMGLNMDIDHIAFAVLRKFDGREIRPLEPAEIAQIAGRAGRHMSDGTFGTIAPLPSLPKSIQHSVERHHFPLEQRVFWRNSSIDTSSLNSLITSLQKKPRRPQLRLVRQAEDSAALQYLAHSETIKKRATSPETVALLWDVCRIPNYRNLIIEHHAAFLEEVYRQLTRSRCLDMDWMEQSITPIANTQGTIDNLLMRIEQIRTWTYISNQLEWTNGNKHWQQHAIEIEERLSDALHHRLVEKFVDKTGGGITKASKRTRIRKQTESIETVQRDSPFAKLMETHLIPWSKPNDLARDTPNWVKESVEASFSSFSTDEKGKIRYGNIVIAQMTKGTDLLHPQIRLLLQEDIKGGVRLQLERRLVAWTRDLVNQLLAVLRSDNLHSLSTAGRGLLYQLEQGLGTVLKKRARDQINILTKEDIQRLQQADIHFGKWTVYVRGLLDAKHLIQRRALCSVFWDTFVPRPQSTKTQRKIKSICPQMYLCMGYPVFGPRAIRADLAEKLEKILHRASMKSPFEVPEEFLDLLNPSWKEIPAVMTAYGFRRIQKGQYLRKRKKQPHKNAPKSKSATN